MRERGLLSSSLISTIMLAVSRLRRGYIPLPHEPTIGLRTTGNPVFLMFSSPDSALNANCVFGEGILFSASLIDVISLFPQVCPTSNRFTICTDSECLCIHYL